MKRVFKDLSNKLQPMKEFQQGKYKGGFFNFDSLSKQEIIDPTKVMVTVQNGDTCCCCAHVEDPIIG